MYCYTVKVGRKLLLNCNFSCIYNIGVAVWSIYVTRDKGRENKAVNCDELIYTDELKFWVISQPNIDGFCFSMGHFKG